MNPITFFKGAMPGAMFAFSSTSSIGTLPVSMECVEKMGGRKDVASFTLPLGATVNMDGTAIYQGVCSIFIAACFGIDLTLGQMVTIVLTATLASIGTAGTPGAGMIMLAMVLQSVGLPVEGIALVAGVDRIFDMGRTAINVTGDMSAAMIVSYSENQRESKGGVSKLATEEHGAASVQLEEAILDRIDDVAVAAPAEDAIPDTVDEIVDKVADGVPDAAKDMAATAKAEAAEAAEAAADKTTIVKPKKVVHYPDDAE